MQVLAPSEESRSNGADFEMKINKTLLGSAFGYRNHNKNNNIIVDMESDAVAERVDELV